jgi:LPS-assembly protein
MFAPSIHPRTPKLILLLTSALVLGTAAHAEQVSARQTTAKLAPKPAPPAQNTKSPVGFIADHVDYDRDRNLVIATGHVQAWQDDQILTADSVTFDRATGHAVARGHVTLTQPGGEVMFADYAELSNQMRDGIFTKVSALLPNNGKLVGNAGRRVDAKLNELSRAVYTACNLCKIPSKSPEWQIKATDIVQDLEHKKIEYHDATLEMWGVPVFWFPYMTHADPSVKRESGFLVPDFGWDSHYLGTYTRIPYYWVINGSSDLTITPTIATASGPDLDLTYRKRFNFGELNADVMGGRDMGQAQGLVNANGTFTLNDTWRYGFSVDTVTAVTYLRDTDHAIPAYMENSAYLEGFGQGSWAKLEGITYQSTTTTTSQSTLPFVLPHAQYSYYNFIDPLGGRLNVDTGVFNVLRPVGTNTDRANINLDWQRPFQDPLGGLWNLQLSDNSAYYSAYSLNQTPNWSPLREAQTARSQPAAALSWRMPFLRNDTTGTGSELIEPIIQLVGAPRGGDWRNPSVPNEDSLDLDFSDANLFSLNRYDGIDRQDGGSRVDAALHTAWYGANSSADALFGQSFRMVNDSLAVLPGSGLGGYRSDYVGHLDFNIADWAGVSYRARLDPKSLTPQMQDAGLSLGKPLFKLSGGYFFSNTDPYNLYDATGLPSNYFIHRNEVYLGASSRWEKWTISADARRDLHAGAMDSTNLHLTYDDECFTFDVRFYRRYTSILNDTGATGVLFQITFKTVGTIGSHAS